MREANLKVSAAWVMGSTRNSYEQGGGLQIARTNCQIRNRHTRLRTARFARRTWWPEWIWV